MKPSAHLPLTARVRHYLRLLGPGLVTGASDDDPSGIATYAVAGAALGYSTLWTAVVTLPLMSAVQLICARIGLVTGAGLTATLRRHYPLPLMYATCLLLLTANVFNISADLGGMADAAQMLTGISSVVFILIFAACAVVFTIFTKYATFVRYMKWTTLVLFSYIAAAFFAHPRWDEAVAVTFVPKLRFDRAYVATVLAILGTTISPYLFFWQASCEVESEKSLGRSTRPPARRHGYGDP